MKRILRWVFLIILAGGVMGLLVFAFIEGRQELAREREREAPIKVPPRIVKTTEGNLIVTIDGDTQKRIALETMVVTSDTVRPEVLAYGRLQEDPGASFVVRAPIAGVVRAAAGREWPSIGESLPDGVAIGSVEPRLAPIERVDLVTRLSDARADIEGAEARVSAARAAFERARVLNADNKNVSDRELQQAEASLKTEEARLSAARRNAAQLEAASTSQAAGTTPSPLTVARGGEVVEILVRPNEAVESGQPVLRVTRFDRLLARVDVPAGENVSPNLTIARIAILGGEDQTIPAERVSLAPAIDPITLGEGFIFRLSAVRQSFRPGTAVVAYLPQPGPAQQAVVVPESAVVRVAGKTWVYRQLDDTMFGRQEVSIDRSTRRGLILTAGLKSGDRIVVRGAQLLLSEEQKSQIQILEEEENK